MTIAFDPRATSVGELEREIEALGYQAEKSAATAAPAPSVARSEIFGVPPDAPSYFSEALERAKAAGKPLVVDFWAPWCGPCLKLKRETLESPELAGLLARFEVIAVNLDETPELGKFYRVSSIPYVLFVDSKGTVVDRLLGFEPPVQFRVRLEKALPRGEESRPVR